MSTTAAAVEGAAATEAPAEGAAAETEETTPVEGGENVAVEGEAPAEGEAVEGTEAKKDEPPAKAEIPEAELKAAALKFANKTMAAARRAEARIEAVTTENATLKQSVKVYEDFVTELQTNPGSAIRRAGFATVKAFLDKVAEAGEGPKAPTAEDEIAALKRERAEEKAAAERAKAEAAVEESKRSVFAAIDADKTRFARTATRIGKARVWDEVTTYFKMHGDVPDAAVFLIADEVEKELRAEFGEAIPVQRQDATKQGAPAGNAAAAGRTSGKTLTNKQTSGAPATREYSLDPDERRKQINDDLRAEGLL